MKESKRRLNLPPVTASLCPPGPTGFPPGPSCARHSACCWPSKGQCGPQGPEARMSWEGLCGLCPGPSSKGGAGAEWGRGSPGHEPPPHNLS